MNDEMLHSFVFVYHIPEADCEPVLRRVDNRHLRAIELLLGRPPLSNRQVAPLAMRRVG